MIHDTSSIHRQAWDLIPWIINGTASDSDRRLAEPHIRGCADCREELEWQRRLQRHLSSATAGELEADARAHDSWQALSARLNATGPARRATPDPQRVRRRAAWAGWLAAAVVAQSIGLGALALALAVRSPGSPATPVNAQPAQGSVTAAELAHSGTAVTGAAGAPYRTLSSAQASAPADTIRAVFAPQTTLAQLQALLERTNLRIVSGPHAGGVWWLAPPARATESNAAVRALRADPLVRFAASGGGSP